MRSALLLLIVYPPHRQTVSFNDRYRDHTSIVKLARCVRVHKSLALSFCRKFPFGFPLQLSTGQHHEICHVAIGLTTMMGVCIQNQRNSIFDTIGKVGLISLRQVVFKKPANLLFEFGFFCIGHRLDGTAGKSVTINAFTVITAHKNQLIGSVDQSNRLPGCVSIVARKSVHYFIAFWYFTQTACTFDFDSPVFSTPGTQIAISIGDYPNRKIDCLKILATGKSQKRVAVCMMHVGSLPEPHISIEFDGSRGVLKWAVFNARFDTDQSIDFSSEPTTARDSNGF